DSLKSLIDIYLDKLCLAEKAVAFYDWVANRLEESLQNLKNAQLLGLSFLADRDILDELQKYYYYYGEALLECRKSRGPKSSIVMSSGKASSLFRKSLALVQEKLSTDINMDESLKWEWKERECYSAIL